MRYWRVGCWFDDLQVSVPTSATCVRKRSSTNITWRSTSVCTAARSRFSVKNVSSDSRILVHIVNIWTTASPIADRVLQVREELQTHWQGFTCQCDQRKAEPEDERNENGDRLCQCPRPLSCALIRLRFLLWIVHECMFQYVFLSMLFRIDHDDRCWLKKQDSVQRIVSSPFLVHFLSSCILFYFTVKLLFSSANLDDLGTWNRPNVLVKFFSMCQITI